MLNNIDKIKSLGWSPKLTSEKPDAEGYRILRRSGDFVMFMVQGNTPKTYGQTYTIINKMGREVEIKESE